MAEEQDKHPPSFAAMFAHERRSTDIEAGEMLRTIVAAVKATGKVGSLIIRIDVKPAGTGEDSVDVFDKLTPKIPEKTRMGARMFITKDGDLSRSDPSAMPLWEEEVRDAGVRFDSESGEVKEAPRA